MHSSTQSLRRTCINLRFTPKYEKTSQSKTTLTEHKPEKAVLCKSVIKLCKPAVEVT